MPRKDPRSRLGALPGAVAVAARSLDAACGKGAARRAPIAVAVLAFAASLDRLRGRYQPRSPDRLAPDNPRELARMLDAWSESFGIAPTSAREAVERARSALGQSYLEDVLKVVAPARGGGVNVRRLGKWLQKHGGRGIGGRCFTKAGDRDHVALWKVEKTVEGG